MCNTQTHCHDKPEQPFGSLPIGCSNCFGAHDRLLRRLQSRRRNRLHRNAMVPHGGRLGFRVIDGAWRDSIGLGELSHQLRFDRFSPVPRFRFFVCQAGAFVLVAARSFCTGGLANLHVDDGRLKPSVTAFDPRPTALRHASRARAQQWPGFATIQIDRLRRS